MSTSIDQLLLHAADELDAGRHVALCLLARTQGSTPAQAGALMVVTSDSQMIGTIGGGCVEAEVRRTVLGMLSEQRTGTLEYQLNHDYGWDDGLICGGSIEIAVGLPTCSGELRAVAAAHRMRQATQLEIQVETPESGSLRRYALRIDPRPRLLIAGAGHVGAALAEYAAGLEFDVTVFDDRADLLARIVRGVVQGVAGPIAETLARAAIDGDTYIVIVTRGHRHDEEALKAVIDSPARYIGMIGSRRKVKLTFDDLRAMGVEASRLARVHAPIGVPIHSVTVREIALSIAAQLVAVRREGFRSPVTMTEGVGTPEPAGAEVQ